MTDPRGQGPGVPGRVRRRPRAPAADQRRRGCSSTEIASGCACSAWATARSHPALEFEELRAERRRREAEEEDRVLYVAMTRARERLLLSGAVDFESWPTPGEIAATDLSGSGPALVPDARRGRSARRRASTSWPSGRARRRRCAARSALPPRTARSCSRRLRARPTAGPRRRLRAPTPATALRRRPRGRGGPVATEPVSVARSPALPATLSYTRSASSSAAATATTWNGCWGCPSSAPARRAPHRRTDSRRGQGGCSCTG